MVMLLTLFGLDSETKYSRRLTRKWKIRKNLRAKEKRILVRIQQRRKQYEGKDTMFKFWNRPVAPHKMTRFLKDMRNTTSANAPDCKPICLSHATVVFLGREQEKQKTNHNLRQHCRPDARAHHLLHASAGL